jgi:DNA-binding IclR family transcriptional regulator
MNTPDDELTDHHLRLLEWLERNPTGPLAAASQALGMAVADVEVLCTNLVDTEMIERTRVQ